MVSKMRGSGKGDFMLFFKYIIIFVIFFVLTYGIITYWMKGSEMFSDYKSYEMDPNKKVNIKNKFTKDSKCSSKDVQYCSKFGKVALNNFNNNDGGCMCTDMESGV